MWRGAWVGLGLAAALAASAHAASEFDARRPKDVAAVVTDNGASGELKTGEDGGPVLAAQAGRVYFEVGFDGCDTQKTLCDIATFSSWWDTTKLTSDEINRWNRWTLFCPAYLDAKGAPAMWYALAVSAHTAKDDVADAVDRWMGCLQDFDAFVAAPEDFLERNAPPAPPRGAQQPG